MTLENAGRASITSVEFTNYKAFLHYSIRLQRMNLLVGPNNCGKSTVIGAFRALWAALRRAKGRSPEIVNGKRQGVRILDPAREPPNIHRKYS